MRTYKILCATIFSVCITVAKAQNAPNDFNSVSLSGNAGAESKAQNVPVDLYTGIPSIGVPVYSYAHQSAIGLNVSLNYSGGGGVKVNETPSAAGLGWALSSGGSITRIVRGVPDEMYGKGYMDAPALPADYRPDGTKYYYDSLDSQQDVFQFNFNGRSGKFFIGKNKQIVTVPLTKLKITYNRNVEYDDVMGYDSSRIGVFTITAENGVKYVFYDTEWGSTDATGNIKNGANNFPHSSAWYISRIIAPFGTDTIKFNYSNYDQTWPVTFPQTAQFVNGSPPANPPLRKFLPTGEQYTFLKKITSISFPDKKTVAFEYDGTIKYNGADFVLKRIKVSDSIFRFGYVLDWASGAYCVNSYRAFLSGVRYYTSTATKPGYSFTYNTPQYPQYGCTGDTLSNKRDHWGYYNGIYNGTNTVPFISGVFNGADRTPNSLAVASSLAAVTDPSGGITKYAYENNDVQPYTISAQAVSVNAVAATQTSISLNQVFNNLHTFTVSFSSSVSRVGTPTFSGTGSLICTITSTDGLTTYSVDTLSLYQIFYTGAVVFNRNIANGSYLFKTSLVPGTSAPSGLPVTVSWNNLATAAGNAAITGGIRVKQVVHVDSLTGKTDTLATYRYVLANGKSSGFLGTAPAYTYGYQRTTISAGGTVTDNLTTITSDPVNTLVSTGNPVGYSRVELIKGTTYHNLGKQVIEFTNLQDANSNLLQPGFPFTPYQQRDWAMGLPERITVYDSLGTLKQVTNNTYAYTIKKYDNPSFQCIKLGKNAEVNNTVTGVFNEYFTGVTYWQESGRADLVASVDSFYHPDSTATVTRKDILYDTNYNTTKIITDYDKTRSLKLEQRLYYPYNYTIGGTIGKLRDSSMFTVVSTENWITGDATPRLLSAGITDFQQLPKKYIRPLTLYALQAASPVPQSTIGIFNPAMLVRNSAWLLPQQNFVTFDSVGNAVEVKNALSGQSNAVIMSYFNQYPVAKISNAKYTDVAYTSFESDGDGNWVVSSTTRYKTAFLTGKTSYSLDNGSVSKTGLNASTTYLLTYWTMNTSSTPVTITGSSGAALVTQQGSWRLYSQTCTGVTTITVSGTGIIDELRLYPKDANMATTTYEPLVGQTSTCDANNTITYYEYDDLLRPLAVRDKNKNVIKKNAYSDYISTLPVWRDTGALFCNNPPNGNLYQKQWDSNTWSATYGSYRNIVDHVDCAVCAPTCPVSPSIKSVNCTCESGFKAYTSSVYKKIGNVWQWECTYRWCWSDHSTSVDYTEYNASSCTVNPCSVD